MAVRHNVHELALQTSVQHDHEHLRVSHGRLLVSVTYECSAM